MTFQPGQSGNPAGKPKRAKLFSNAILVALKRTDENDVEALQRLADRLVRHALTSAEVDIPAIKEIADRVEGKVPQGIVGGDEDDSPVRLFTRIERVIVNHNPELPRPTAASSDGPRLLAPSPAEPI